MKGFSTGCDNAFIVNASSHQSGAQFQIKPRIRLARICSGKIAWKLPRHYLFEKFENKGEERSANRNGSGWEIKRETEPTLLSKPHAKLGFMIDYEVLDSEYRLS